MTKRGPIFLAGIDRSGIGLLCELLEAHPNIAMTRRTNFWSFYFNRCGDLGDRGNLEQCLQDMMSFRRMQVLQPDAGRLRREFARGEATYARLFELLQQQRIERLGKHRWGDKSLDSERHAETIFAAYPDARMIHVIRDPRDRCASAIMHRGIRKDKAVSAGTALWLRSARLAERNLRRYPYGYKVIRYETLVAEPEASLRDICDFVGEDFSPVMLTTDATEGASKKDHAARARRRCPREIRTTSVGRFRAILSAREVGFLQVLAKQEMLHYGYDPMPIVLTKTERLLFYVVDCPTNIFRIAGTQAWRTITDHTRRQPSPRKTRLSTWPCRRDPLKKRLGEVQSACEGASVARQHSP